MTSKENCIGGVWIAPQPVVSGIKLTKSEWGNLVVYFDVEHRCAPSGYRYNDRNMSSIALMSVKIKLFFVELATNL